MYAHDIIGNFKAGMNAFIDWNLMLDEKGGPNHVGNLCDAPLMCDASKDTIDVKLSYYYIGQFSRFIKPGARRMLVSSYSKNIEAVGFQNPDGEKVLMLLNSSEEDMKFIVAENKNSCPLNLEKHSIMTICW